MQDVRPELEQLLRAARAHLEAEVELGEEVISPAEVQAISPEPLALPGETPPPIPAPASPTTDLPASDPAHAQGAQEAPTSGPRDDLQVRGARLAQLAADAERCTACVLHEARNKSVFARGSDEAELMFVGEGPGRDEDRQGYPFVGAAGKLLDRMIVAMGYRRDEVYVCNVVKCRPPNNRTPRPEEAIACARFLEPQIDLVAPRVIVALGRCAAQNLNVAGPAGPWRGRWGSYRGIPVMPTYHPAFLLRSPEFKRTVWEDLQLAMARLGKTPPSKSDTGRNGRAQ